MAAISLWLAAAAMIFAPGVVIRHVVGRTSYDGLAAAGESAAIGIAFWPLLFLFSSATGTRWNAPAATAVVAMITAAGVVLLVRERRRLARPHPVTLLALLILALVAWTRLGHIDGIALPLWVDSVHHTMIVRLLLDHGALPATYAPFIADSTFYYHWGFHALTAFLAWTMGMTGGEEVARLLLLFGQFLNVLSFLAVYAGARALFRSRGTALLAATMATLVSFFPAYYVSWGRYTQLCGLLLLPVAAALLWETGRHPRRAAVLLLTLVAAGLLLIHVRVAVMFLLLAAVLTFVLILQRKWRGLAWVAAAAVCSIVLASPWLIRLVRTAPVRTLLSPAVAERAQWETSNHIPADLLWAPNNRFLIIAATAGMAGLAPIPGATPLLRTLSAAWWLALVFLLERNWRRRNGARRRFGSWRVAIVIAWVLLAALMINGHHLGLPRVRLVPNSAAIIMLFLPLSLMAAHLLRWAIDALVTTPRRRTVLSLIAATIVAAAGASTMVRIINPVTLLATAADREALEWIRSNTPAGSRFAVGVQPWIGGSYIGNDGGYWISVAADRSSILPPGLYAWVMDPASLHHTIALLDRWYGAQERGDLRILAQLEREGVRYLYFGPRNGSALRAAIAGSSDAVRVYSAGGVDLYRLRERAPPRR